MSKKENIGDKISEVKGFQLEELLGAGAMGEVWKSTHPQMKFPVAFKLIDVSENETHVIISRFLKEARLAGSINHPNILRVYEAGNEENLCWMALELCRCSLQDSFEKGELTQEKTAKYFIEALEGMHEAHSHGIIHRDLKPANLLIAPNDRLKIADLGIAKNVKGDFTNTFALTVAGTGLGTPHYVSPEQAVDAKNVDRRADIYSLGATFFHLFTGRTPFTGNSQLQVLNKHISEPLEWPENHGVDQIYVKTISKMMEKKPEDRYASCKEIIVELEESKTQPFQETVSTIEKTTADKPRNNSRHIIVACIIFSVLITAFLIIKASFFS